MGGVIWVNLTWGETSKSKQRGPPQSIAQPCSDEAFESWLFTVAAPNGNNREYLVSKISH